MNVGIATIAVSHAELKFIVLGQANDPSHTGIFGVPENNADIAVALAKCVNEFYPASNL